MLNLIKYTIGLPILVVITLSYLLFTLVDIVVGEGAELGIEMLQDLWGPY